MPNLSPTTATSQDELSLFAQDSQDPNWFDAVADRLAIDAGVGGWPDIFGERLATLTEESELRPIRTLSLFSGGGGLDIGFHQSGFQITDMVEAEEAFASTLESNFTGQGQDTCLVHCEDVRNFQIAYDANHPVDFIIGGPPCQTFSSAGRRAAGVLGTDDPRGTLFEEYVRLLGVLRPKGFLFENVYGIVGANGGQPWRDIVSAFDRAGYVLSYRVLDAADYGVPQHRERLFIVGVRRDLKRPSAGFLFPRPSHGPDSLAGRQHFSAGCALDGLSEPTGDDLELGGRYAHLLPDIPPGLNYSFFTKELGHPNPVFAWRSKFSDFLYKADPDFPVRTVKAQGGAYTGPLSWRNRFFSIEELKRLQTFPDTYILKGARSTQVQQLGNSVPPQMARILAIAVREQLFDTVFPFEVEYLRPHDALGFRKRKREATARYAEKARSAIAELPKGSIDSTLESVPATNRGFARLTNDFDLHLIDEPGKSALPFSISFSGAELRVRCHVESTPSITLMIQAQAGMPWGITPERIQLLGDSPRQLMLAFKLLEHWLRVNADYDDLVQVFGYYQNDTNFVGALEPSTAKKFRNFKVLEKVFAKEGVGRIETSTALADLWSVHETSVITRMRHLRALGFEVRNHNTNPQIEEGSFLIPYPFPTLNPRSVQLRKTL